MAIKITQQEYQNKFGQPPVLGNGNNSPQPIQTGMLGNIGNDISNSFQSGLSQTSQGFNESVNATNPLTKVEGAVKMTAGLANTALSPLSPIFKPISKGIDYLSNKISNIPAVQKFANSKIGNITSRVAEDVGNINTIAGTVAGGMEAPKISSAIPKVTGEIINKTVPVIKPTANVVGRTLKSLGEKSYSTTIIPEETTSKMMNTYNASKPTMMARIKDMMTGNEEGKPVTEANTAARHGLMGTERELGVQAKRISDKLWSETVQPKLQAVKGKLNMKDFWNQVEKEINKESTGPRKTSLKEGLESLKENYKNVSKVSLEKLQDFKEAWAEFVPEAHYKGKPIASSLKAVQDMAASKARQIIYKHIGEEGRMAYLDYGNLKSIIKSGIKSIKDPAKQGFMKDIWQAIMDKAVTPVATVGGRILYKTGEGLEFVGHKGAKTVRDITEGTSDIPQKLPVKSLPSDYKPPVQTKLKVQHLSSDYINGSPKKLPIIK